VAPLAEVRTMNAECTIEGCSGRRQARGWCGKHYMRWRQHGDPHFTERPTWGQPADVRFWSKVDASGVCWEWTASDDGAKGYGRFDHQSAHRWAYEFLVGPIPEGMTLDHLCLNKRCVNPDHLEVVTAGVNTLRGGSVAAVNARKTHCPAGHPYEGDNLRVYIRPSGHAMRTCKACIRQHNARRRAASTHAS
jgi:hypothetical protein